MKPLRSFLRPVFLLTLQAFSLPLFALDASRLEAIGPAMQEAVRAKQAAGIVTLVLQDGKVIHHGAAGMADAQKGRPMDENALFWIASMTKSVNATALMLLVDEGKLALDTPASQWLPELGKMKLQNGESPKTPITLRMLLSHTAGIAFPPPESHRWRNFPQGLRGQPGQSPPRLRTRHLLRVRVRPHRGGPHSRNRFRDEI